MADMAVLLLVLVVLGVSAMAASVEPLQEYPAIDLCQGENNCLASVRNNTPILCSVEVHMTANTVRWYKKTEFDEVLLNSSNINTSTKLSFAETIVTFADNNLFELLVCKAPSISNKTAMVALELSPPHYQWAFNESEFGQLNKEIVIRCADSIQQVLIWKKRNDMEYETLAYIMDNLSFVNREDYNLSSNGSLIIPRLSLHHKGEYACIYGTSKHQNYRTFTLHVDGSPPTIYDQESSTARMWIIIFLVVITGVSVVFVVIYIRHRRRTSGYSDKLQKPSNMEDSDNQFKNVKRASWKKGAELMTANQDSPPTLDLDIESNLSEEAEETLVLSTFGKTTPDDDELSSSSDSLVDEATKDDSEDTVSISGGGGDVESEGNDEAGCQDIKPMSVANEINDLEQPHDVLTLGTEIIILMDNTIQSFTWEGKMVRKYQKEGFQPFAGTECYGKLYVTDKESKSIVTFDKSLNRLGEFGNEYFTEPGGITVCKEKGYILVLNGKDVGIPGISVFSLDGKYVKDIGPRDLADSLYIKCNHRNEFLISYFNSKKVQTFDIEKGKLLDSFSTNLDGSPMHCRGLAVDQGNNIYVAVRAPGLRSQMECITKYNAQGFQIKKYLESPPPNKTFKKFWKSVPLGRHIDSLAEDVLSVGRKIEGLSFTRGVNLIEKWDKAYLLVVDSGNKRVVILELTSII